MTLINPRNIFEEILYGLRNDLTDPSTRGTAGSQTFTATAGQTVFSLTNNPVFNVKTVTVASVSKTYGSDYTVAMTATTCVVTLTSGATLGQSVVITYHYSNTWIFTKDVRTDMEISNYPRIGFIPAGHSNEVLGCNLEGLKSEFKFRLLICYTTKADCRDMLYTIKSYLWTNRKSFYYFTGLVMDDFTEPVLDATRKNEVYTASIGITVPDQLQV